MPKEHSQDLVETPQSAADVDRLFDRVSSALTTHSDIVRELKDFRELLLARERAEAEARHRAERVSECLMSFLQALGHDIRTPFIAVDSAMQLLDLEAPRLSEPELRARIAADSHTVRRTCNYGLAMAGDLFELLRANAGKWRYEPSQTDLLALVNEVRELVQPQARAKGIEIIARLVGARAADVAAVWTDRNRLKQALVNVVSNAVKFSESGAVEIDIASQGDTVELRVRDRGPGLDPATVSELFEPFRQGRRTEARAGEGLGLGLAIAQRCAQLIGGSWSAANRDDGGGAVFTLRFPRHATRPVSDEASAARALDPLRADRRQGPARRPSLRVLIVDDAVAAARLAQHHLVALGHTVTVATTVAEAARILEAGSVDLVVSDIELPDGSGLDVLAKAGSIPVLYSSARSAGSSEYARAAGAVPKPITREALRHAIDRVFGSFGAQAAPSGREPNC